MAKEADAPSAGRNWASGMWPEIAILRLRKELDLFANLCPALVFDPLIDASMLMQTCGLDSTCAKAPGVSILASRAGGDAAGRSEARLIETYTTNEIERVAS